MEEFAYSGGVRAGGTLRGQRYALGIKSNYLLINIKGTSTKYLQRPPGSLPFSYYFLRKTTKYEHALIATLSFSPEILFFSKSPKPAPSRALIIS